jgi:hypothetical protein
MKRPSIEELRAAMQPAALPPEPSYKRQPRSFLHGPLDWGEICQVRGLGDAVLAVWLLLHYRKRLTGDRWLSLPTKDLERLGISRWTKDRAVKALESEGFIRVQRNPGCSLLILLVRES